MAKNIKSKIFLCGGVMLLLLFIQLMYILDSTNSQVTTSPPTISAFIG